MSVPRFKLYLRHVRQNEFIAYTMPVALELGGMLVPVRDIRIDWSNCEPIGEVTMTIGMQYMDIVFEEEQDALPDKPDQ